MGAMERTAATNDQPPVTVSRLQKPYFMTEYVAGSGEYLRAFVVDENSSEVRLRFPGSRWMVLLLQIVHWQLRVTCLGAYVTSDIAEPL